MKKYYIDLGFSAGRTTKIELGYTAYCRLRRQFAPDVPGYPVRISFKSKDKVLHFFKLEHLIFVRIFAEKVDPEP